MPLLFGSTLQPWRRNEIEKRVSKVQGIRELHSESSDFTQCLKLA